MSDAIIGGILRHPESVWIGSASPASIAALGHNRIFLTPSAQVFSSRTQLEHSA